MLRLGFYVLKTSSFHCVAIQAGSMSCLNSVTHNLMLPAKRRQRLWRKSPKSYPRNAMIPTEFKSGNANYNFSIFFLVHYKSQHLLQFLNAVLQFSHQCQAKPNAAARRGQRAARFQSWLLSFAPRITAHSVYMFWIVLSKTNLCYRNIDLFPRKLPGTKHPQYQSHSAIFIDILVHVFVPWCRVNKLNSWVCAGIFESP